MPNDAFSVLLDAKGLRNALVYPFSELGEPMEVGGTEGFDSVEEKGNQSQRLDTGGPGAQVYNWLGMPVFCDMKLTVLNDDGSESADTVHLLTVICEVTQKEYIDVVHVQGLTGSIKTHIYTGDYEVTINGVLSTDNANDFPIEDLRSQLKVIDAKKSLAVVSDYFSIFGIYNLVVMEKSFVQTEGNQNTQVFNLRCLSDRPLELIDEL